MTRAFALFPCCFFFSTWGTWADEFDVCSTTVNGMCIGLTVSQAMEEGLELLQKRVSKHSEDSKDVFSQDTSSSHGAKDSVAKHADTSNRLSAQSKSSQSKSTKDDTSPPWKEQQFEKFLLQEHTAEKVRFRARHQNWIDILELYEDGFLQRHHGCDAGVWSLKKNKLVLHWIRWGNETLQSTDGGVMFARPGNISFTMRSYVRPTWWKTRFQNLALSDISSSAGADQAGLVDSSVNMAAVVAAHINGSTASLDENGYRAIALQKDNNQTKVFVSRLATSLGLQIRDEGNLMGFVPFYSGVQAVQSFEKLSTELRRNALVGRHRWITLPGEQWPTTREDRLASAMMVESNLT